MTRRSTPFTPQSLEMYHLTVRWFTSSGEIAASASRSPGMVHSRKWLTLPVTRVCLHRLELPYLVHRRQLTCTRRGWQKAIYDMSQHLCPDYYAWLAEVQGNAGQHPPSSGDTPKTPSNVNSESTTTFLQLLLVDGRLASRSTGSSGDCLPSADLWDIERRTRDQSSSGSWHKERSSRLTASNFHSVVR